MVSCRLVHDSELGSRQVVICRRNPDPSAVEARITSFSAALATNTCAIEGPWGASSSRSVAVRAALAVHVDDQNAFAIQGEGGGEVGGNRGLPYPALTVRDGYDVHADTLGLASACGKFLAARQLSCGAAWLSRRRAAGPLGCRAAAPLGW